MIDVLLQPLGIYILALSASFLIPLFYRASKSLATVVFMMTLVAMAVVAGLNLLALINGAPTIDVQTAGIAPPFAINLRFGLFEGGFVFAVNIAAMLGAWHYLSTLKQHASAMLIYIILVMGIDGMIMTRDLFNLFIFIEITSIATYAMIGFERVNGVLSAGFK